MHREWFPIDYQEDYFRSMKKRKIIAIGCFYKTDLDIENNKDILIGSVMAKIHGEDSRTQPVFVDLDEIRNGGPQSWWQLFKNTFSCRAPKERQACYIMTIGVIDEVRKLGIGTRLLESITEHLERFHSNVEAIYLHVIIYNNTALKFYEKNGFKRAGVLK